MAKQFIFEIPEADPHKIAMTRLLEYLTELATILGTKTPGRLLSGSAFKAGFGYIVGLPVAAYLTWQGKLIEGRGVSPSVAVAQPPEQLLVGEDPQMQKALELARQL